MNKDTSINKDILTNHFYGRSTPLQKKMIEDWLASPENIDYYYQCLDQWENKNPQFIANDSVAFERLLAKKAESIAINKKTPLVVLLSKRMAVAAAILLVICGGLWLSKDQILYKTITTNYGEIKQVSLPDGSILTLNANSQIMFARFNFNDKTREVLLNGEADFSVVHTKSNQRFVVKTNNNLNVTVLGTKFTVYNRNAVSKVVLIKGKVELNYLQSNQNKELILKPGDSFTKSIGDSDEVQHLVNAEKLVSWKNHDFLFEAIPLSDVASVLKDNFGVIVRFQTTALATRKISGSFHAEKAEELIDAIAQLLDVNYKSTKNNIIYLFE